MLGIQNQTDKWDPLWQHINDIVLMYHERTKYVKITPGSLRAALKPLSEQADRLSVRIGRLDQHSRGLLAVLGWTDSDALALRHTAKILREAVTTVEKTKLSTVNWPLRMAVTELFYTFANQNRPPYDGWTKFVSEILTRSGIRDDGARLHLLIKMLPGPMQTEPTSLSTRSRRRPSN